MDKSRYKQADLSHKKKISVGFKICELNTEYIKKNKNSEIERAKTMGRVGQTQRSVAFNGLKRVIWGCLHVANCHWFTFEKLAAFKVTSAREEMGLCRNRPLVSIILCVTFFFSPLPVGFSHFNFPRNNVFINLM